MYQLNHLEDTIVAISTPIGHGGIGIIRLSGKNTLQVCDQLFLSKNKKWPSQFKSYTVHYGWVIQRQSGSSCEYDIIDEALLTVMRAPKSYTKEDIVEISCHGGLVVLRRVLALAIELGARLAEPGEFTKRAFLNGRIDLTQAEAVLDIIQAKTDAFAKVGLQQLKGDLSLELEGIREGLMKIYTGIEAIVNFPEDDLDLQGKTRLLEEIRASEERVMRLVESSRNGQILKEGIKVVLCGKPNVGKSSLLNALLKQPRAIVTEIAGTTRDTIEEIAQIKGIPFQLVDTAGILNPRDVIEEEAIRRSHAHIDSADLILFVLDGHQVLNNEDELLIQNLQDKNLIVVYNKCDLEHRLSEDEIKNILPGKKIVKVSAITKAGIGDLEHTIIDSVWQGRAMDSHGLLISNARQINALKDCAAYMMKAEKIVQDGLSLEFISEEIKCAVNALDSITGRNIDYDLLDRIFTEFCIGK